MSRDERICELVIRMFRRWVSKPDLIDRVRWGRWITEMERMHD